MIPLQTWGYSPEKGKDVINAVGQVDFDPHKYITPHRAAMNFARSLVRFTEEAGYNPENVFLWTPETSAIKGFGKQWTVCWEEGPFEWALNMSAHLHAKGWYTEPYNSFILCFVEN